MDIAIEGTLQLRDGSFEGLVFQIHLKRAFGNRIKIAHLAHCNTVVMTMRPSLVPCRSKIEDDREGLDVSELDKEDKAALLRVRLLTESAVFSS